jgi:hypothetical protein
VPSRLETANQVLVTFAPGASIQHRPRKGGSYVICWTVNERAYCRRWQTRGQDFYPLWKAHWCGGGTSLTALSQLVRWLRGVPVLPLRSWEHWASPAVQLLPPAALDLLRQADYPVTVSCVVCQRQLPAGFDWHHLGRVSGPCCRPGAGCRKTLNPRGPHASLRPV